MKKVILFIALAIITAVGTIIADNVLGCASVLLNPFIVLLGGVGTAVVVCKE